jgi:hypothetical protein
MFERILIYWLTIMVGAFTWLLGQAIAPVLELRWLY